MSNVIFWLIMLIGFIVAEVATMGLTTIWFAGGALLAIFAALAGLSVYVQTAIFLMVSFVLLISTRPIAMRFFNGERVKTNVDDIIGKQAIVLTDIDNLKGVGQAILNGMEWSASSQDDEVKIPAGAVVIVRAVRGVKLIVEEKREEQ